MSFGDWVKFGLIHLQILTVNPFEISKIGSGLFDIFRRVANFTRVVEHLMRVFALAMTTVAYVERTEITLGLFNIFRLIANITHVVEQIMHGLCNDILWTFKTLSEWTIISLYSLKKTIILSLVPSLPKSTNFLTFNTEAYKFPVNA